MSSTPRYALVAVLALLIGLNLRPIMAAVGPLLDVLQQDLGLSSTQASLLTTLPVLLMGICALGGPRLPRPSGVGPRIDRGASPMNAGGKGGLLHRTAST